MNEIVNNFLLAGDEIMPEILVLDHLQKTKKRVKTKQRNRKFTTYLSKRTR